MYLFFSRALYFRTVVLLLLLFCAAGKGYGQRVYADQQQSKVTLLASVTDEDNAKDNNYSNYSTLNVGAGVLGLIKASQNLQFSGTSTTPKPKNTSPVMIKFSSTASILSLVGGVSIQRTNDQTLVGTNYTTNTLLTLLNGSTASEVIIPIPSNGDFSDGVRLQITNYVVGLGLSAQLYYAFYITPPEIQATITACTGETATATITNFQEGYTYRLYDALTNGNEISGTVTTTATLNIPFDLPPTAPGEYYYLEARENDLYPSARIPIALVRNAVTGGSITGNQILCANTTPAELKQNTAATGSGTLTYQWQSKTSGTYIDIPGATALTYSPISLSETTMFRRVSTFTLNDVICKSLSNELTITINPLPGIILNASTVTACQEITTVGLEYSDASHNPISYSVDWGLTAEVAGFTDILNKLHSFSSEGGEIFIDLPANISEGTYQGVLTIKNTNGCTSNGQNIMVNILSKPPAPALNIITNSQY